MDLPGSESPTLDAAVKFAVGGVVNNDVEVACRTPVLGKPAAPFRAFASDLLCGYRISTTKVLLTVMGGKDTYRDQNFL